MISRKNIVLAITVVLVGSASFYFGSQNTGSSTTEKTLELTTVKISKGDLAKKEEYNGTLSQVDKAILNSSITGVITYLPEEGTVINYGQVLYAVDNKPVILLEGSIADEFIEKFQIGKITLRQLGSQIFNELYD